MNNLRKQAEEIFKENLKETLEQLSPNEIQRLIHELRVHQIELELQNEELKGLHQECDQSRILYVDLYDFAPVGYLTVNDKGVIEQVNLTCASMVGIERGRLLNSPISYLIAPEDHNMYYLHRRKILEARTPKPCELRMQRKDKTQFHARLDCAPDLDENGDVTRIRIIMTDITERKQAEEELRESRELTETVVENVPLMIFLKESKDLRFVIFNHAGEELLGYDRRDLLGKNNLDLFPPEQAAHFMAKDREVLDGEVGMLDIPEEPIMTNKKGERLLHTRKVCIRGSGGAIKYLLGISEDITERKRAEENLLKTLESLRKAFNATIQIMVSTVEARDPYTAGHQVRSADLARAIAMEMGLSQEKIEGILMAGSIHDIGKISIPAEILSKPTKLSEDEFALIKDHARRGFEMLKGVESPWPLAEIVYQHHERMDGSGYPCNLKGEEICIEARILSVADVVEAMSSHRPYRPGLGIDVALSEIEKNSGIFYDRAVADACLRLFREKGYQIAVA